MKQEQLKTQYLINPAAKAFKLCPSCGSSNLFKFDGEAICFYCDWNSVKSNAELNWGFSSIGSHKSGAAPELKTHLPNDSFRRTTSIQLASTYTEGC